MKIQKNKFADLKEIADVIGVSINEDSSCFEFATDTKEGKILKDLVEYKQELTDEPDLYEDLETLEHLDEEDLNEDEDDYDEDDLEDFYDDKHLIGLIKTKNFLKLENQLQDVIDNKIRRKIDERKVQYLKKLRGE